MHGWGNQELHSLSGFGRLGGEERGEGLESQEEVGGCMLFMMLSVSRQELQDTPTGC
jgi:hypothetical protein